MALSDVIKAKIDRKQKEKDLLDEKIELLEKMIEELGPQKAIIGKNQNKCDDIEPVYEKMIGARDNSFGTLKDYYEIKAKEEQTKYQAVEKTLQDFAKLFMDEYNRAILLLGEWKVKSGLLKIEIADLWVAYWAALESEKMMGKFM